MDKELLLLKDLIWA